MEENRAGCVYVFLAILGKVTKVLRAHISRFIGCPLALRTLPGEENLESRMT